MKHLKSFLYVLYVILISPIMTALIAIETIAEGIENFIISLTESVRATLKQKGGSDED